MPKTLTKPAPQSGQLTNETQDPQSILDLMRKLAPADSLRVWLETARRMEDCDSLTLGVNLSLDLYGWHKIAEAMAKRDLCLDELVSELIAKGEDIIQVAEEDEGEAK